MTPEDARDRYLYAVEVARLTPCAQHGWLWVEAAGVRLDNAIGAQHGPYRGPTRLQRGEGL